jgi:hypothetical protein
MRHPTDPSSNVAALVVARCEKNRKLRNEALAALEAAQARATLNQAIEDYGPRPNDVAKATKEKGRRLPGGPSQA